MSAAPEPVKLEGRALLEEARRRAGLRDIGPTWILEALDQYAHSLATESGLSPAGAMAMGEIIIRGLVNRLRMFEAIRLHPGILDEELHVAAAITGLPRTGSTMFHRALTAVPGLNGVYWWELQNFAPFPGEIPGQPVERIAFAEAMVKAWLEATPEFAAIHPLDAHAVDEESILLHLMFCGAREYAAPVPSFVAWQSRMDFHAPYEDLRTIFKFLQWQKPERRGRPWVLKAPEHMIAPEAMLEVFPETKIIITHRDPAQVLPSLCSMHYSIQRLCVAEPDKPVIGRAVMKRFAPVLQDLTSLRARIGDSRFIDVDYRNLLKNPVEEARAVLAALGYRLDETGEAAIHKWLEENARENRASHAYSPEEFGLTAQELDDDFRDYRKRFMA